MSRLETAPGPKKARLFFPIVGSFLVWIFCAVVLATLESDASRKSQVEVVEKPLGALSSVSRVAPRSNPDHRIRTCWFRSALLSQPRVVIRGTVLQREDSEVLWSVDHHTSVAPASVQKLFTAAAAWRVLGPNHRLETSVWANPAGEAWLVGGGDPTITRSPGNNYYGAKHSLAELAQKTVSGIADRGLPPIQVLHPYGSRYESFESWDESWRRGAWSLGYVAPVTAIQVDGDRDIPSLRLGKRSANPEQRAQAWFIDALNSVQISSAVVSGNQSLPDDAIQVASVESAALSELIGIMLLDSDNSLAEVLAREVALSLGTTDYTAAILGGIGWEQEQWPGLFFQDGSGLSPLNRQNAVATATLLEEISRDPELSSLIDLLPVSGETGSLQRRFTSAGSLAAGAVSAKTGSIEGVRSLAGYLTTSDGDTLYFSLNLSGPGVSDAQRDELDALVEGLYLCGENLAQWGVQPGSNTE